MTKITKTLNIITLVNPFNELKRIQVETNLTKFHWNTNSFRLFRIIFIMSNTKKFKLQIQTKISESFRIKLRNDEIKNAYHTFQHYFLLKPISNQDINIMNSQGRWRSDNSNSNRSLVRLIIAGQKCEVIATPSYIYD